MKKTGSFLCCVCFSALFARGEEETSIDIRKYHQPMEEKVFELEEGDVMRRSTKLF